MLPGRGPMRNSIKWIIPAAILAYIYYPTALWMIDRWGARDSYFGHGFLIPLVSLYWIVKKKNVLAACEKRSEIGGAVLLLLAVTLQIIAAFLRIYFLSAFSFVILLFGAVWFLFGRKLLGKIWFPLAFLFLMIPLPLLFISQITLAMKFFVSEISVYLLNLGGIHSARTGSYIQMPHATILIGDPCSGLRSFLAFLCLGFVFSYDERLSPWKKSVLIFAGLPLAIFSNVTRVYSLALLSEIYGEERIAGTIHDISGYAVFVLAFLILMVMRSKLEKINA